MYQIKAAYPQNYGANALRKFCGGGCKLSIFSSAYFYFAIVEFLTMYRMGCSEQDD